MSSRECSRCGWMGNAGKCPDCGSTYLFCDEDFPEVPQMTEKDLEEAFALDHQFETEEEEQTFCDNNTKGET